MWVVYAYTCMHSIMVCYMTSNHISKENEACVSLLIEAISCFLNLHLFVIESSVS